MTKVCSLWFHFINVIYINMPVFNQQQHLFLHIRTVYLKICHWISKVFLTLSLPCIISTQVFVRHFLFVFFFIELYLMYTVRSNCITWCWARDCMPWGHHIFYLTIAKVCCNAKWGTSLFSCRPPELSQCKVNDGSICSLSLLNISLMYLEGKA